LAVVGESGSDVKKGADVANGDVRTAHDDRLYVAL